MSCQLYYYPKLRLNELALFRAFGATDLVLSITGAVLLLVQYGRRGGYVFEIHRPFPLADHFVYFLIAFIGVWLTLEWVQFAMGKCSLLKSLLQGNPQPLYALLLASALFGVFWETVNSAHHLWIYTNWPLPHWRLMTVPVTVLLTWPLQYVVFLSIGFLVGRDMWV